VHRHQRLNTLLEMLGQRGRIEVDEAADELKVSLATIRRDLDHLAEQQLLTRTRGGAVTGGVPYDLPGRSKPRHVKEKERIAAAAARLVQRGMVVGLNGGTTTREVARAIASRPEFNDGSASYALTVVTNALTIANDLAVRQNIKTVTTGGVARTHSFELTGPYAAATLNEVSLEVAFLGVDAIDPLRGVYSEHEAEANVNRLMATRARHVIVVADASKLGGYAFARVCATLDIDMLITSAEADPDLLAAFEIEGVKVRAV
jgi:DeoR family transcriptional regulator, aga operon transcriptional repressor